ncbi:MAG: hypothetical protein RIG77_24335 [Cyclobacteriaceae bacterium]
MKFKLLIFILLWVFVGCSIFAKAITVSGLEYKVSSAIDSPHKETLEKVIVEEIQSRTGFMPQRLDKWKQQHGWVLAVVLDEDGKLEKRKVPSSGQLKSEGYKLLIEEQTIWVIGADVRGALYGIGRFLIDAQMSFGQLRFDDTLQEQSSPQMTLRGHQLGYRNTANSWDKWTPDQFDQYIRELALFGTNSIEDIPFQSVEQSVHMVMPHKEMHPIISGICHNYDLDYWVWVPAQGDLSDQAIREKGLQAYEELFRSLPRLDGVFFPGGDPGHNHPRDVMPYLKDIAALVDKYHPDAGVWISLQGFDEEKVMYFFDYLNKHSPDWLTGLVNGPSSPPIHLERQLLPEAYQLRLYGDLTHTVRCQYPTPNWDQAYALTLGREAPNPQPYYYADVLREEAPFIDGFLSYSDGAHDDVNKVVWNQIGWDLQQDVRSVMQDYARFFFGDETATDGILALEKNWDGPLVRNGAVEATLTYWQQLENAHPELNDNWRWQLLVLRAFYDAFTRQRLIREQDLEQQAYVQLAQVPTLSVEDASAKALAILKTAEELPPTLQQLRVKIEQLAQLLFEVMGLQSSVPMYQASGYERGSFMDFIDIPLNNRWWIEDQLADIGKMEDQAAQVEALQRMINWENPGKGGFYDDVSNVSASPHVVSVTDDAIDYAWWDDGKSRKRLSTQLFQFSPVLEYKKLDAGSDYRIRVAGYGEALLRANGERLEPTWYDKELEGFKEFVLPAHLIPDGNLRLTFDRPDESHLNWRQYSKVTEVWLMRRL